MRDAKPYKRGILLVCNKKGYDECRKTALVKRDHEIKLAKIIND